MKKDTFYFSHDYNARQDDKIKRLIMKHGFLGYGIFWAIVENLYNNTNALRLDCELIAYEMRTSENVIESIINDFELFVIEDGYFGSLSVERRLIERDEKSKKASKSALSRWNKNKEDANALQTQSDSNAIKEKKVKEKKVKEIVNHTDLITWRGSFEKYIEDLNIAVNLLLQDNDWILEREKFHPNLDIKLSMEKAYKDFWGTEAGWKHKKKSKVLDINWKSTFNSAIELNKVYKQR